MVFPFFKQYYKSILIGLLILWLSLTGSKSLVPGNIMNIPYYDKLGHFVMYTIFSAILLLDSCHWHTAKKLDYIILIIPVFFGALVEVLQMTLTTNRKAELLDLVADIIGVLAGLLSVYILRIFIKKIRS